MVSDSKNTYEKALLLALRHLERKPMFKRALSDLLMKKGFSSLDIEDVFSFLETKNLIDDRRTLKEYVHYYQNVKLLGFYQIKQKLLSKGAPIELVENGLGEIESSSEFDQCLALCSKKIKNKDPKNYPKAARYLAGKGYAYDVIQSALQRYFQEEID